MPDISMCTDTKCSRRESCYRYRAVPNTPWQSYGSYIERDGQCDRYDPLEENETRILPMSEIESKNEIAPA